MNSSFFKQALKNILNEKASLHAGNLAYLTILALAPTLIIVMSVASALSGNFPLLEHPYFQKISAFLSLLSLNVSTSIIINIICINLLSSGFYSLLITLEDLYGFTLHNYIKRKSYSVALSLITILVIVLSLSLSFTLTTLLSLKNIQLFIDFIIVFISLLIFYKLSTFQKIKHLYLGSLISSIFLTLFIHFFYLIITNFSHLSSYYGMLTPLMIAFLLIYYSCYIIYFGILINYQKQYNTGIKNLNK